MLNSKLGAVKSPELKGSDR